MNILLLQGPLGPFFKAVSRELQQAGHQVYKVHFNGGDAAWSCHGTNIEFSGPPESWETFLRRLIKQKHINSVICYGDCRFYHRIAATLCKRLNVPFWVIEEGYLRPDFITMELGGANAFSPLYTRRDSLSKTIWKTPYKMELIVGDTFSRRAWFAIRYHVTRSIRKRTFPHYISHRPWTLYEETRGWVAGGIRKLIRTLPDRRLLQRLQAHRGAIFFVPLQVTEDYQIREHSDLSGVEDMVAQVITNFSEHADPKDILLFKHHPMDRGYVSYRAQIDRLCKVLGLQDRVFYGFELPLPALYPLLKGVVTINSTVGLSALLHKVPTFCMGRALYDIEGLTSRGSLARFWHHPAPVCPERFERLRQSLLHLTQLNASFYRHQGHGAALVARRVTGEERMRLPARTLEASA